MSNILVYYDFVYRKNMKLFIRQIIFYGKYKLLLTSTLINNIIDFSLEVEKKHLLFK